MTENVTARCHCGSVVITADLRGPISGASRCTCSFCRRRQAANVSASHASLKIIQGADLLRCYQFGTATAEHYFCARCGIYTHHRRRSDPGEIGINLGCIDGVEPWVLEPFPWNDGVNHPSDT